METIEATPPPVTDLVDLWRLCDEHPGETIRLTPYEAAAVEADIRPQYKEFPEWRIVTTGRIILGCTVELSDRATIERDGRFHDE